MPKPLCFMVMPYGRKPTQAVAGKGPAEIDFNRLWDLAYVPVIQALGYEPVRADQDTGALIVTEMLERLYFANLVLADMTIANGNVYYEIGIRHAAQRTGCVLLAADWSQALFDVAQLRTVRYPLPEGDVTDATAQAVRAAIQPAIPRLGQGVSPMHEAIKGYPGAVKEEDASTMRTQMARLADFQGKVRAVRAVPKDTRMARAMELVAAYGQPPMLGPVAIALLKLLRDSARTPEDWGALLAFMDALPAELKDAEVGEQRALALSNTGRHTESLAELLGLVEGQGPTPERMGLLGGRYKRLAKAAATDGDRADLLAQAIRCYERGMELDLNEYYCSSNLPRLYRQRARAGDEDRAHNTLKLVIAACERARKRGVSDPWLRPTLLVAAFDDGDADKAEELADQVQDEGPAAWQMDSIRGDLDVALAYVKDAEALARLKRVKARFDA